MTVHLHVKDNRAKEHLMAEAVRRKGKMIHIRLHPKTHQALKVQAAESSTTIQTWTNRAIRTALRKQRELVGREMKKADKAGNDEKGIAVQS